MRFTDKTVLVTGAAGIYGQQIARAFAHEGARLLLTDRRKPSLEEYGAARDRIRFLETDLGDAAAIASLLATLERDGVCPDILVNNAGIYPFGGLFDTDAGQWDEIMSVNLRAPFLLTQGIAGRMIERGIKGAIICIGSGAAHVLRTNGLAYCVSKRGLDWLVKGMALELAHHGIRVNSVEPALAVGGDPARFPPGYIEALASRIPLGCMAGDHEAADAVLFLASDAASYITGATLAVDGGSSIPRRLLDPPKHEKRG